MSEYTKIPRETMGFLLDGLFNKTESFSLAVTPEKEGEEKVEKFRLIMNDIGHTIICWKTNNKHYVSVDQWDLGEGSINNPGKKVEPRSIVMSEITKEEFDGFYTGLVATAEETKSRIVIPPERNV